MLSQSAAVETHPAGTLPARGQAGVTLLEVVVAAAILLLTAAMLAAAIAASMRAGSATRERALALAAAESQLAVAQEDTSISPDQLRSFPVPGLSPRAGANEPGSLRVETWQPPLVRITITVEWRGAWGDDRLELTTILSRK